MGRVVAISGGNLQTTERLNMYALKLSGKESPNVLFIGTASMDSDEYAVLSEATQNPTHSPQGKM